MTRGAGALSVAGVGDAEGVAIVDAGVAVGG